MVLYFFLGIVAHELSHYFVHWYLFREWANISINKTTIRIIPTTLMRDKEKKLFLGVPIITGMFVISLFIFKRPNEATYALIAYLFSCGMDFWNLVLLEVKKYEKY